MKTRIKRFKAAAAAKLKSQAGDTFIEVLAAGLIIVLGIAMAVTMIGTSSRLVTNADKVQNEYYSQRNHIENMNTNSEPADYQIDVTMQAAGGDAAVGNILVTVYTYTDEAGHPVLSYFKKK